MYVIQYTEFNKQGKWGLQSHKWHPKGKSWQRVPSFRINNLSYLSLVKSPFQYLVLEYFIQICLGFISYFFEVCRTWLNGVWCFKLIRRIHSFWVHGSIYIVGILVLIITYYTLQLWTSLLLYFLWPISRCTWWVEMRIINKKKVTSKWNKVKHKYIDTYLKKI